MKWRRKYLAIMVLLTLFDAVVTLYEVTAVWTAWSGDTLGHGLLPLFAEMAAASLASVWVQARSRIRVRVEDVVPRRIPVPFSPEIRGQGDV